MDIKLSPWASAMFVLAGATQLLLAATGSELAILHAVIGVLLVIGGALSFTRPAIRLTKHSLARYNVLGMETKSYVLQPGQVEVRDNKIFVGSERGISLFSLDASESDVRAYLTNTGTLT